MNRQASPSARLEDMITSLGEDVRNQPGVAEPPAAILGAGPRLQWKPNFPALREQTR